MQELQLSPAQHPPDPAEHILQEVNNKGHKPLDTISHKKKLKEWYQVGIYCTDHLQRSDYCHLADVTHSKQLQIVSCLEALLAL